METILITAMDRNRIIGYKNCIPWHIPEEMQHFKKSTMGHAVIMGRKTHESIGMALPGRQNVVLSRNRALRFSGCEMAYDFEQALDTCKNQEKVFIIGGKSLYQIALEYVDTLLISVIHSEYKGDTSFPPIPEKQFQLIHEKKLEDCNAFILQTFRRLKAD